MPACVCLKAIVQIDVFIFPHEFILGSVLEMGYASRPLPMLGVVTRRIPFIRVPLSLAWHSKEIYDLTLRQPWIQLY